VDICSARPEVERVSLYGSRAVGDCDSGSDIDLAIDAPEMGFSGVARLDWERGEEPILFRIDLHRLQDLDEKVAARSCGTGPSCTIGIKRGRTPPAAALQVHPRPLTAPDSAGGPESG